jgi:hypothetical protein
MEKMQNQNGQLCNLGKRQQTNPMMFNPPYEKNNKKNYFRK